MSEEKRVGGPSEIVEAPVEVELGDIDVSEEVVWKRRALDAESALEDSNKRVKALEEEVSRVGELVTQVERRGEIDVELSAARAVDLETARLLTEMMISEMDEPDVPHAVRELSKRKPFLFDCETHGVHSGGISMGPSGRSNRGAGSNQDLDSIGVKAKSSGDRGELLRYLRVRRSQ